jgi:WD40 repeat protein
MEIKIQTKEFNFLNFNIKKIIFSFLKPHDQRKMYWSNKALRPLLPDSTLAININRLRKRDSYESENRTNEIIELSDGLIACISDPIINLFNCNNNLNIEVVKSMPITNRVVSDIFLPILHNQNIIFLDGNEKIIICDKNFNVIQSFKESSTIYSLCNISSSFFAVGLYEGDIKIYSINEDTKKYEGIRQFKYNSDGISSLLYLFNHEILLSGSCDKTIDVISFPEGKLIKKLTGHNEEICSFIYYEDKFVSGSMDGDIKFWSIKSGYNIECVFTVKSYIPTNYGVHLYLFGNDLMVYRQKRSNEFQIWHLKSFECLQTFKEEFKIHHMVVTKQNTILASLNYDFENKKQKIIVWKISE